MVATTGKSELIGQLEDAAVELGLSVGIVGLNFEVIILEGVGVPRRRFPRAIPVVGQQVIGDLACHACRGYDDAFVVAGKKLAVDTRARIEALGEAE